MHTKRQSLEHAYIHIIYEVTTKIIRRQESIEDLEQIEGKWN